MTDEARIDAPGGSVPRGLADDDLRASERRYRSLVEATTSIVWMADVRHGFVDRQPSWEEYTGQRFEEYQGFRWGSAVHPDDRRRVVAAWREASARAEVFQVEGRLWHAASGAHRWCVSRGAPVLDDAGFVMEWVGTCTDVDEQITAREEAAAASAALLVAERAARQSAEAAAGRSERLARIVELLSASLTEEGVADVLADKLGSAVGADTFVFRLVTEDGSALRAVRMAGYSETARDLLAEVPLSRPTGVGDVLSSGDPMFVERPDKYTARYPEAAEWVRLTGVRAWADLPLTAESGTTGVIHLGFLERRLFDPADRAFLSTVAVVAGQVVRRAGLIRAEQDARRAAEAAARRLRRLQEISDVALSRLSTAELVAALRDRLSTLLGVDTVRILLVDDHGRLPAAAPDAAGEPGASGAARTAGPAIAGQVAASRRAVVVSDAVDGATDDAAGGEDTEGGHGPERRLRSAAGVPLLVGRRLVGVLDVGTFERREFTEADVELLELAAERIALALDRSRAFEVQREMARTLQAALLPPSLPAVAHLSLAARYIAAGEATDVGGDFYDVFAAAGGTWLAVVGDVCGRGPEAAAMTGLARHTVRVVAQESDQPIDILSRLNTTLGAEGGDERFATAVCARLEPSPGKARVTLSSGGHCRPIILRAGGDAMALPVRGTMLGPFPEIHLEEAVVDLAVGDSLVLYTDGVVEAQGPDGLFGEGRLLELLSARAGGTSSELAGAVEEAVWAHSGGAPDDDLAILVVQVPPVWTGDVLLDERLPPGDLAPRAARRAIEQLLDGRLPPDVVDSARLAVSELVTNAVRYGRRGRPGETGPGLRVLLSETTLRVEVRNRGRRFSFRLQPAGPLRESGRGLDVVRAVAGSAGVDEEGTTVTVWCTFPLVSPPTTAPPPPGAEP